MATSDLNMGAEPPPGVSCRLMSNVSDILLKVKWSHTGLGRPLGLQEVEAPRFLDNRHMKVVRLSALRTGRHYAPGNIPGTHFC
jgi:hypothetical protein